MIVYDRCARYPTSMCPIGPSPCPGWLPYGQYVDDYSGQPAGAGGGVAVRDIATGAVIDECVSIWGVDLLAYLLGAGLSGPLAQWRRDTAVDDPDGRSRLRAAHEVAILFDSPPTARAWVRRPNFELAGRCPADVIRTGGEEELRRLVELADRQVRKD